MAGLILLLLLGFPGTALSQGTVVVNPGMDVTALSQNAIRSIFGMRLRNWPDQQPIRVFVLPDQHPVHEEFSKQVLNIFPNQLRRAWDRLVYSGTGQAPIQVETEQEMLEKVASTPGAIGYLSGDWLADTVKPVRID